MQASLTGYYPPVVKQIKEIQQITKAEGLEFEKLALSAARVLRNMFVSTATEEGVSRFEKIFGISPAQGQSLDRRKEYIHFMMNRRKMSLSELEGMLSGFSNGVRLVPNYNNYELEILIETWVDNLKMIYEVSDEILPLQLYIYFAMELTIEFAVNQEIDGLIFTAEGKWWNTWRQEIEAEMETSVKATELFGDTQAEISKDLWRLDGAGVLDGGRNLNAEVKEEEL